MNQEILTAYWKNKERPLMIKRDFGFYWFIHAWMKWFGKIYDDNIQLLWVVLLIGEPSKTRYLLFVHVVILIVSILEFLINDVGQGSPT
jgi:hypothetical protein